MTNIPNYKFALRKDLEKETMFLPKKGEPRASGWDVRAAMADRKPLDVKPFDYVKIPLGFRAFCPEGWWYELKPRSSSFAKKSLHALYGTIDETFENELVFAAQYIPEGLPEVLVEGHTDYYSSEISSYKTSVYHSSANLIINFGDAVGQIIPIRRQDMIVENISNVEYDELCKQRNGVRGTGGFGSTNK
jgi:dUTPase